ncbi:hypothetical protein HD553DRAFT_361057 [Filobasidium floriforme]|uniref:uncharacterized protein n=1 Tax=Filobasidium floriforme TaxID=5210 RepID=UPI001E8D6F95|nr:uncharacterized protein HD553DRAFT_361057 [Filobasidium floriforme]KAH8080828.1 hypothetical protein HD553DRAFT_361057 [Filobasidium floriforme]
MATREEIVTLNNGILCLVVLEAERHPSLGLVEDAKDPKRVEAIFQHWIDERKDCLRNTDALRRTRAWLSSHGSNATLHDSPIVLVDEDLRMQPFRGTDYSLNHTRGVWEAPKADSSLIKLELVQTFALRAGPLISMTQQEIRGDVEKPAGDELIVQAPRHLAWSQWICYIDSRKPTVMLSHDLQTRLLRSFGRSLEYCHERLSRAASHNQSIIPANYSDSEMEGSSALSQLSCSRPAMTIHSEFAHGDDSVVRKPVQSTSYSGSPVSIGFVSILILLAEGHAGEGQEILNGQIPASTSMSFEIVRGTLPMFAFFAVIYASNPAREEAGWISTKIVHS